MPPPPLPLLSARSATTPRGPGASLTRWRCRRWGTAPAAPCGEATTARRTSRASFATPPSSAPSRSSVATTSALSFRRAVSAIQSSVSIGQTHSWRCSCSSERARPPGEGDRPHPPDHLPPHPRHPLPPDLLQLVFQLSALLRGAVRRASAVLLPVEGRQTQDPPERRGRAEGGLGGGGVAHGTGGGRRRAGEQGDTGLSTAAATT